MGTHRVPVSLFGAIKALCAAVQDPCTRHTYMAPYQLKQKEMCIACH